MNLFGSKVLLRAMEPGDMDMYREMANDPETERLVCGWSFPLSVQDQQLWYERASKDKNNLRFTIEVLETHQAIGMVNLVDIDWKNRCALHGVKLAKAAPKGCGYATDAVMTLMQYAFEELQLNRLDGAWLEYNKVSQALYQKCGWTIEGTKREAAFKGGRYWDSYYGGILRQDFLDAKERLGWNHAT